MRRPVHMSLLLTALVLLVPTLALVGCDNLGGPAITDTSLAQNPIPEPPIPPVPGTPTPGQPPPGGIPGEVTPPGDAPGDLGPSGGTTPGGTSANKTTTTTAASNPGATIMSAEPLVVMATRYQETDSRLIWAGSWNSAADNAYSGGTAIWTSGPGASVTVNFSGTSIAILGAMAPNGGLAMVTIDGATWKMDCYSPTISTQQILWQSQNLASGGHTVKINSPGTSNLASSGLWLCLDALEVTGALE
jgi:hypothetical protein